jgi:hypothetical protein
MARVRPRSEALWQWSVLLTAVASLLCFYRRPAQLPIPDYSPAALDAGLADDRIVMVVVRGWDAFSGFASNYVRTDPVASVIEKKNVLVLETDADEQRALLSGRPTDSVVCPMVFVYYSIGRSPRVVDISDILGSPQAIVDALEHR